MTREIHWICSDQALKDQCEKWQTAEFLAIDTEFIRVNTYYPIAGLIQVSDAQQVSLIDPLQITIWQPFAQVLENTTIVKVLHACGEDLEIFQCLMKAQPTPLFDTQLAAGYLNLGFSMGYSRLVQMLLEIELPKEETRSDWLQRPLTEMQVLYAAQDAVYLAQVYQELLNRLSAQKLEWVLEDGAQLAKTQAQEINIDEKWTTVKQAWKLSAQQLSVLKPLAVWREQQAQTRNLPRNRVLKEASLFALAEQQPKAINELASIPEMHTNTIRRDGATLLELIAQAQRQPKSSWPEPLPEPLTIPEAKQLKKLRKVAQKKAEALGIAPELMVKKKVLEALLRSGLATGEYQIPDDLIGWRRTELADDLLNSLQESK